MKSRLHIIFTSLIIISFFLTVVYSQQQTTLQHRFVSGWNLVSVPLQPVNPSPSAVFDEVTPPLYLYDYVNGFEVGIGEPGFTNIAPGRCYNLLLRNATTVTATGSIASTTQPYHNSIVPGWNHISSPWPVTVPWNDARVSVSYGGVTQVLSAAAASGWIEGSLQSLNPADGSYTPLPPNDTPVCFLLPWRGYLLFSTVTGELIMQQPPPDNTPPAVAITSPVDDTKIALITSILGTVQDDNLVNWTLEYAPVETRQYTVLATGDYPLSNEFISKLDPTLLLNGMVNLRLTAVDFAGNISEDIKTVLIEGENKLGVMRISFVDLEVPVAGIPITIKRTYDSRTRNLPRDFGYGWSLEVGVGGRYMNNRKLGDGWEFNPGPLGLPCIGSTASVKYHVTEVRFSDREFYRFSLQISNPYPG